MKKAVLILCLAASILLTSACSSAQAALSADTETASASQAPEAASKPEASGMPERSDGRRDQNSIMGKITAVSDTEITVTLADTARPDRGTPPSGGNTPKDGEKPSEPPADASGPETHSGKAGGGRRSMEFTGETVTYTLAGGVVIQKGAGEDGAIDISALAVDDVVRIGLNDDGEAASIQLMDMPDAGGEPPERPAGQSEAS